MDTNTTIDTNTADKKSARISADYANRSILDNHMHNSIGVGNHLELYYYSSDQGRLELQRRIDNSPTMTEYQDILDIINHPDFSRDGLIEFSDEETQRIHEAIDNGTTMMEEGYSDPTTAYGRDRKERRDILHALADYSREWLSTLTTAQQEAISHITSSGFILLQGSIHDDDHEIFSHPAFTSLIPLDVHDHEEIVQIKRDHANAMNELVIKAFENAPVADNPVISYRGTCVNEVKELVGVDNDVNVKEFVNDLVTGRWDHTPVSEHARIHHLPVSSSAHVDTALGFGYNVILEIKRSTITSPVNVSAWGPAEAELLTNPTSTYTINSAYMKKDSNDRDIIVVQIEEHVE